MGKVGKALFENVVGRSRVEIAQQGSAEGPTVISLVRKLERPDAAPAYILMILVLLEYVQASIHLRVYHDIPAPTSYSCHTLIYLRILVSISVFSLYNPEQHLPFSVSGRHLDAFMPLSPGYHRQM